MITHVVVWELSLLLFFICVCGVVWGEVEKGGEVL